MNKKLTIKDYKANSESDIEIVVKTVQNENDPMGKRLYEGILGNCPDEYDDLRIDEIGRSLTAEQQGRTLYYLTHIIEG